MFCSPPIRCQEPVDGTGGGGGLLYDDVAPLLRGAGCCFEEFLPPLPLVDCLPPLALVDG